MNPKVHHIILLMLALPGQFCTGAEVSIPLVSEIESCISHLKETLYVFGASKLDCKSGVALVDCSGFIDAIVRARFPNLYKDLLVESAGKQPRVIHYFSLFNKATHKTENRNPSPRKNFNLIQTVPQLTAGDLLLWKYSEEYRKKNRTRATGHIMIVLQSPVLKSDDLYLVRIADSALSGHVDDTRSASKTGLGVGSIWLQTDQSGKPIAYAWNSNKFWERQTSIIMANIELSPPEAGLPDSHLSKP